MSRAYRPPEVIMLEPNYSKSADIWSLGCIIAEILLILHGQLSGDSGSKMASFLFTSRSCYPLSPIANEEKPGEEDHLKVILEILGD